MRACLLKMKTRKPLFRRSIRLMACCLVLLSCGEKENGEGRVDKEGGGAEKEASRSLVTDGDPVGEEPPLLDKKARGHDEVLARLFEFKREFLGAMNGITDTASARDFVETLEERKAGISKLLEEAQALPPPGPAFRRRYQKMQGKLAEQSDLVRRQMEERLENHPEAAKIGETLGVLAEDQEAEDLNGAFEELYQEQNLERECFSDGGSLHRLYQTGHSAAGDWFLETDLAVAGPDRAPDFVDWDGAQPAGLLKTHGGRRGCGTGTENRRAGPHQDGRGPDC